MGLKIKKKHLNDLLKLSVIRTNHCMEIRINSDLLQESPWSLASQCREVQWSSGFLSVLLKHQLSTHLYNTKTTREKILQVLLSSSHPAQRALKRLNFSVGPVLMQQYGCKFPFAPVQCSPYNIIRSCILA